MNRIANGPARRCHPTKKRRCQSRSRQGGGVAMEYLFVTIFAAGVSVAILASAGLFLESQLQALAERWQLELSLSLSDLWPGS